MCLRSPSTHTGSKHKYSRTYNQIYFSRLLPYHLLTRSAVYCIFLDTTPWCRPHCDYVNILDSYLLRSLKACLAKTLFFWKNSKLIGNMFSTVYHISQQCSPIGGSDVCLSNLSTFRCPHSYKRTQNKNVWWTMMTIMCSCYSFLLIMSESPFLG